MGAWSLLLVSLRTRIVSAEICFLYWLRDNTLCYALSKCLLFTFWWEEKDSLVVFSANGVNGVNMFASSTGSFGLRAAELVAR